MKAFICVEGIAVPFEQRNVDTDQIVPGRFLKRDRALGYGAVLFHDLRFTEQGDEIAEFVLNQPAYRDATILVTGENFGCGSSREAAVYALADYGIRAVIAPSFGDIFHNNCLKNGILPVCLPEHVVSLIGEALRTQQYRSVVVDLENQQVRLPDGTNYSFHVDAFWRTCLLQGMDELELTLSHQDSISNFEDNYYQRYPWAKL